MRKKFLCAAVLILAVAFCICSCGESVTVYEITEDNAWQVYPADEAPLKTVRAGDRWYSLMGRYNHSTYSLCVSGDYESLNKVYTVTDAAVWFLEATEDYAVFSEMHGSFNRIMLCEGKSGTVSEVFSISTEAGYQNSCVGIYGDCVYFAYTDYAAESAQIKRYRISDGTRDTFAELPYHGEYSCMSLSVDGSTLLAASGTGEDACLMAFDLDTGAEPVKYDLDGKVKVIYACAYDTENGGFALYYSDDKGGEHIATVNKKNGKLKNIYTFGESAYAYQDTLEMRGGHIYWVTQINASGMVADHYRFVDYDTKTDSPEEYLRTFSFTVTEDGVQLLAFNKVDYDAIYLTEIYLGGNRE